MTLAYEIAQERARQSYEAVEAPPCPGCGRPVRDEDWEKHRRLSHGLDGPQPYGKADSREALFVAEDRDDLGRKIARWRDGHPGCRLLSLGEGVDRELGAVWGRFRVVDGKGRRAQ